jgi:RIO kinase 2
LSLAKIYRKLEPSDFRVLGSLDASLDKFEFVPVEYLERRTKLNVKELARRLDKLEKLKLISRGFTPKLGYRITYLGLDSLALHALVNRNIVAFLGTKVGVGKESEIYIAKTPENKLIAIKFYKIGRISFRKVKRVRPYLVDETNWLIRSKIAAEREYKALGDLIKYTEYVPTPVGWNRHAVVIEFIEGIELYRYKDAIDPENMLNKILSTIRVAYLNVNIVHGDLSEYNILVTFSKDEEIPIIIDWPQYIYRDDPRSDNLLRRDVEYIVKFFKRRYRTSVDVDRAFRYIKGEIDAV